MSKFELKLPQMGESVAEATLTSWLKEVGDAIEADEAVFEIATDKVDSEVPSEVDGVLVEKRFEVDDVVKVGQVVAVIELNGESDQPDAGREAAGSPDAEASPGSSDTPGKQAAAKESSGQAEAAAAFVEQGEKTARPAPAPVSHGDRFYSPLVRNMAREEGIGQEELDRIPGTGKEGRVTKSDMLAYLESRGQEGAVRSESEPREAAATEAAGPAMAAAPEKGQAPKPAAAATGSPVSISEGDEVIPMSRMGKLIAKHMAESVSTSAHVQSFVEVDVTRIVEWRDRVKADFEKREGEKLTFTPIFMEAVAKALKKFPMMNISVDGDRVIKKKQINLGMAAALPDGNLIVPVIRNADQLNLVGMARAVNDLATRARNNALKPDEVRDGTYTVTNVGSFGSVFGTPIINQPQVGILALGAIRKVPAVIETPSGDFIGIRSKMFLSHSYDHRVVNGALGGLFVKAVADYLEAWDTERDV
ncbi:dihydrolipoamide acetyltransferase family protein [Robiginitalea biformata]|uniref:Dihydrolipoamide acetyltransferase component of pyruvate dehydrogenase complex n=1 Tax=Robiginitalea biformata (strain ATCC BAA-864 / DSM 15991 / KCTC 12146 / HTCC2501) TaxID=313596 RepID=A4CQ51_ROBBH|nr:dihydrolipoamide acetyltransferase family protein [Robiginitalea biformata]EAR14136.1 lipoamide acyltransferase component of branched-chain alpha-keto acid dehydrogenase complex [Robiginitalea biformata HTCC2501]